VCSFGLGNGQTIWLTKGHRLRSFASGRFPLIAECIHVHSQHAVGGADVEPFRKRVLTRRA